MCLSCYCHEFLHNIVKVAVDPRGDSRVDPVIDHEFRHNIVKVAVDPRGDSRVDPQTTLTML